MPRSRVRALACRPFESRGRKYPLLVSAALAVLVGCSTASPAPAIASFDSSVAGDTGQDVWPLPDALDSASLLDVAPPPNDAVSVQDAGDESDVAFDSGGRLDGAHDTRGGETGHDVDASQVDVATPETGTTPDSATTIDGGPDAEDEAIVPVDPARLACLGTYSSRSLDTILAACPTLRSAILWEAGDGSQRLFDLWSASEKQALRDAYATLLAGNANVPATCPDPIATMQPSAAGNGVAGVGYVPEAAAFEIYVAHVAHALHLETTSGTSWSLLDLAPSEASELLGSPAYHARIRPSNSTDLPVGIVAGRDFQMPFGYINGRGRVCRPRDAYDFVRGLTSTSRRDLLGRSAEETLARLTLWMADTLRHGPIPSVMTLPGFPLTLADRLRGDPSDHNRIVVPVGCHSATVILRELARSVNIPLLHLALADGSGGYFGSRQHGALAFRFGGSDPLILEHVDDTYAMALRPFVGALPVDGTTPQAEALFFATTWVRESSLRTAGLLVATGFPLVVPAVGIGEGGPPPEFEDRYDYGRLLGEWSSVGSGTTSWRAFTSRQCETVCCADLVETYCSLSESGYGWQELMTSWAGTYPHVADATAAERTWNRLASCVSTAGGCSASRAAIASYRAKNADTVWGP